MTTENDDDISALTRQRTSREEVRRRNREIMERANAELLEGKPPTSLATPMSSGKRELSRFGLIQQARDGAQTFWTPYEFHTATPELSFGPLRLEINVDQAKFTDFNRNNMRLLLSECLKSTCLIDDVSVAYLDLVNPEEAYASGGDGSIDPLDEPLLTNDVSSQVTETHAEGVYTGHFLRKPQLMSNDLFTEGSRSGGSTYNRFTIPAANSDPEADEFSHGKELDGVFREGRTLFNSISKKEMRVKRVMSVLPGEHYGSSSLYQFKMDERGLNAKKLEVVMDRHFQSFQIDDAFRPIDKTSNRLSYTKHRKFSQTNRGGTADSSTEDYFLLTIPPNDSASACFLYPVSHKILLKKDGGAGGQSAEGSLTLNIANSAK